VVAGWLLWAAAGCQSDRDLINAALSAHEADWHRNVSSLRDQQVALSRRFEVQRNPAPETGQQLRVALAGAAQSLNDVEIHARQVRPFIDEAFSRGGDEAARALESETARMNRYFQVLSETMGSAAQTLDDLERRAAGGGNPNGKQGAQGG
jgi:uncharacterized membrane protein YccC